MRYPRAIFKMEVHIVRHLTEKKGKTSKTILLGIFFLRKRIEMIRLLSGREIDLEKAIHIYIYSKRRKAP